MSFRYLAACGGDFHKPYSNTEQRELQLTQFCQDNDNHIYCKIRKIIALVEHSELNYSFDLFEVNSYTHQEFQTYFNNAKKLSLKHLDEIKFVLNEISEQQNKNMLSELISSSPLLLSSFFIIAGRAALYAGDYESAGELFYINYSRITGKGYDQHNNNKFSAINDLLEVITRTSAIDIETEDLPGDNSYANDFNDVYTLFCDLLFVNAGMKTNPKCLEKISIEDTLSLRELIRVILEENLCTKNNPNAFIIQEINYLLSPYWEQYPKKDILLWIKQ